jgi:hypothetical protein
MAQGGAAAPPRPGFAPALGPLLERALKAQSAGPDVHAESLRGMHAGALAELLRNAALARDWPRAAGAPRRGARVRRAASAPQAAR